MKLQRYVVGWHNTTTKPKHRTSYFVTDAETIEEVNDGTRPAIATFPISQKYPEKEQAQRADTFRDYMNKIVDATETAYQQTMLCDILKA
jgi:hypothetical protein